MSLDKDADRGRRAEEVLDNDVYSDAYKDISDALITNWRAATSKDEREELHKLLKLLDKVQNVMESTMRSGKLASAELAHKRSLAERVGLRRAA